MYKGEETCNVKCPFFIRHSQYGITCEGVVCDTETTSKFSNETEKKKHMQKQCNEYPNKCSISKMLDLKYALT